MVCILTVLSLLGVDDSVAGVTGTYGEPDIYRLSLVAYCGQAATNFEVKMLTSAYLDSLASAVDSLYLELRELYSEAPDLLECLDRSHSAFLEYSELWAMLCEERVWWDTSEGVRYDGTARGYEYGYVLALYRWQKIVSYTRMLDEERLTDGASPDTGMLGLQAIGGYRP
ncbi:MAG: hypothetical protein AVO35_08275 [Candidatus Aegiribacteria sp. MLS_C]|nr:MAG: hypothetical protein AVO35_08275 [Candidatus Aegiribacteria sp. MLS_C]